MKINKTMSDNEIIKELKSIDAVLQSRGSGLLKKFGKKIKSKAYKHNDVLDLKEYEINGNRVLVCFQKMVITDKLSDLSTCYLVLTEDYGAFSPNKDMWGNYSFYHFTNHAIERLQERLGLTLKDFFVNEYAIKADGACQQIKYDGYGYDDSTYIIAVGRCFFIVCERDNNIVFKTVLDRDSIHKNQLMLYVDSKRIAEKNTDIMYEMTAESVKRMGVKKTNDIFRAMCA